MFSFDSMLDEIDPDQERHSEARELHQDNTSATFVVDEEEGEDDEQDDDFFEIPYTYTVSEDLTMFDDDEVVQYDISLNKSPVSVLVDDLDMVIGFVRDDDISLTSVEAVEEGWEGWDYQSDIGDHNFQ